MNAAGQVVGVLLNRGFLYSKGKMVDLGTLGGKDSYAADIDAGGRVVGWAMNARTEQRAFLYKDGKMVDLGTLGGPSSVATAINADGQIVGSADVARGGRHAFLYEGGKMKDLCAAPNTPRWDPSWINDAGQIVGSICGGVDTRFKPVLWSHGNIEEIASDEIRQSSAEGDRINASGQIAGMAYTGRLEDCAFVHGSGKTAVLRSPIGKCFVGGINASGEVVGFIQKKVGKGQGLVGYVYSGGQVRLLTDLLVPSDEGWRIVMANAIDDSGRIAAAAFSKRSPERYRAVLLTPVPSGRKPN
jgi:probable HAF family extracellular repeat protein